VETADLVIHYHVWGPEDGPVIIAFHGWPDDAWSWNAVAQGLADEGFRVYAPYLRGFGPTSFIDPEALSTGQLAALVTDALAFADAMGLQSYSLIGHDWGGRIVQAMAVLHPERVEQLVSLSGYSISYAIAPPPPPGFLPELWYQFALNLPVGEANLIEDPTGFIYAIWSRWTPSWDKVLKDEAFQSAWPSWQNPDFIPITLTAYSYIGRGYDPELAELEERLANGPAVPVPALIIQGADDPLERPEITGSHDERMFTAGLIRHILPETGHWPHRESPKEVVQILLDSFATRVED
jgi:pimeloyl-ACP methyl ester carboxylesterase